jgi:uncharacterized protein with NRDE domain
MCILTFVTHYCERFPFILIGNRDEQLGRGTRHLSHDVQTGFLWAVDEVAGGSWMGIDPRSGRFTILTNCRRAPAAPLARPPLPRSTSLVAREGDGQEPYTDQAAVSPTPSPSQRASSAESVLVDWRGAAPLSHIRRYTKAVPVRPELRSPAQPDAVTLVYDPPSSRGTIVKNFLASGTLPTETPIDSFPNPPRSPLTAPFYAGYNLLSCDTLRSTDGGGGASREAPAVFYTTNRYGAQYRCPVSAGEVHVLQNSFLDNTQGEPISARLRQLFETALHDVVMPLGENPSATFSVVDVATRLVSTCLCDRSNFDVAEMMRGSDGGSASAESEATAAAVRATVHSTNPLLGFHEAELHEFFRGGDGGATDALHPFNDGGAALIETYLQANILKVPVGGHGTRVQSMVLVERVPVGDSKASSYTDVIYFCQRDVAFEGAEQRCVGAPWIVYRVDADGSFVRVAE